MKILEPNKMILENSLKILNDKKIKSFGEYLNTENVYQAKCTSFLKDCIYNVNKKIPLEFQQKEKYSWNFFSAKQLYSYLHTSNLLENNHWFETAKNAREIKTGAVLSIVHDITSKFTGHSAIVEKTEILGNDLIVTVIDCTESGHGENDFRLNGGVGRGQMKFTLDTQGNFTGEYFWHVLSSVPSKNLFLFVNFKEFSYG